MLVARGERRIGNGTLRWAMGFTGAGFFQVFVSDGILCDTRVTPPADGPARPIVTLHLITRGAVETFGALAGRFDAPVAIAMRHEHYEGAANRRTFAFRTSASVRLVELHVARDLVGPLGALPATFELDAATWDEAARATDLAATDPATLEASLRAVIGGLGARGVLTEEGVAKALRATPAPIARLWRAMKPTIEQLALAVTANDLGAATDLSASQVERTFRRWAAAFALVGPGLRSVTHNLRLKTAVLFLSAEGATVADVAAATGYKSADAMARAFRDAGIAAPSEVQRRLRDGSAAGEENIG